MYVNVLTLAAVAGLFVRRYCSACVSSDSVSANLRFLPASGGDATAAATSADGTDDADGADDVDDGNSGCVAVEAEAEVEAEVEAEADDEAEERSTDGTVPTATAAAEGRFFFLGRSGRLHGNGSNGTHAKETGGVKQVNGDT